MSAVCELRHVVHDSVAAARPVAAELIDDADAAAWDRFVAGAAGASAYHHYGWREVVREVFGHQTYYFATRGPAHDIDGVLPLVRLKSLLFGDFLVSLPYFNCGGVVSGDDANTRILTDAATTLARTLGCAHLELRHVRNSLPDAPMRTDKVAMLLPLPATAAALQQRLPSKLRAQIRRPVREGAISSHGGLELLDDFYQVFARTMLTLGTPVYPRRFFQRILERFPAQSRIFVVRIGGQPVAAGLVISHRGTLEIPWAGSLRSANAMGVNMLLYWSVLEYACETGHSQFDFGRCTPDSGTYRFKKQWGAEPVQLHWHYWLRDGTALPQLNPANPKFRLAVAAWQRLPLAVANWLGPHVVKYLP